MLEQIHDDGVPLPRPQRTLRRIRSILVFAASIAVLCPGAAHGHAIVVAARPPMNATVATGALDVALRFNSRIDRARSRLVLRAPDGTETAVAPARDAPPDTLAGRAELRAAGAWTLDWQVLSFDGHVTRGQIRFRVRDGAAPP